MFIQLLSEFLGTLLLILSILVTGNPLVIGATLAICVFFLGPPSGSHVNPAVSLTFYLKGALSLQEFIGYLLAQIAGGAAALYTYKAFL